MRRRTVKRWVLLSTIVAVASVGFAIVLAVAARRDSEDAAVWLSVLQTSLTYFALVAAVVAAWLALPGYRTWMRQQRERPVITMSIDVGVEAAADLEPVVDGAAYVPSSVFAARVVIHNSGDAPLRWSILNIQVLSDCLIEASDPPEKHHYESNTTGNSGDLVPGEDRRCHFTVAERDFPPGHHFMYHVTVRPPQTREGPWPICAVLEGYPRPRVVARAEISTYRPEHD